MRSVTFGPMPPKLNTDQDDLKARIDYLEKVVAWQAHALRILENVSHETDAKRVAQGFAPTNITADRAFDCDTVAVAELADAFATFINDLNKGGSKATQ